MLAGSREAKSKSAVARLPTQLPIYVFSGSADPVHGEEKNLQRMLKAYQSQNPNVTYQLYAEGRHEMLNETNRAEVVEDLVGWLATTLN
jgi:alpha-beta hydrolase superfamily lysophospholipase